MGEGKVQLPSTKTTDPKTEGNGNGKRERGTRGEAAGAKGGKHLSGGDGRGREPRGGRGHGPRRGGAVEGGRANKRAGLVLKLR